MLSSLLHVMWIIPCAEKTVPQLFTVHKKGQPLTWLKLLDRNLSHLADVVASVLGEDHRNDPGAGAAGGLGFAFKTFLDAQMRPGIDVVMEATHMDTLAAQSDIIITGEGRTDYQTAQFGQSAIGCSKVG